MADEISIFTMCRSSRKGLYHARLPASDRPAGISLRGGRSPSWLSALVIIVSRAVTALTQYRDFTYHWGAEP